MATSGAPAAPRAKTGDQMDDFLEARAAKIETGDGADSTSISLNCLKGDFDAVFDMYLELLRNPEFRADKLELAKQQAYTGIARRNDDVGSIVGRESRCSRVRQRQSLRARGRVHDHRRGEARGPAATGTSSTSIPTTSSSA